MRDELINRWKSSLVLNEEVIGPEEIETLKPVKDKGLNKYGRMRRTFLQEQKPMLFDDLVLTEQLFPHLYEVQEIAEKRVEVIMVGLLEKNPAPDKETDAMAWARHMNLLKAVAEEVVVRELIYT